MNDTDRQHLIERYIAAYNSFDIDGMAAVLRPDVRFDNFADNVKSHETAGIAAFRTLALSSAALFSRRRQTIMALEFDPDKVIATIAFSGTVAHDIPGGPAAGAEVAMAGSSTFTFDEQAIATIVDRS
jgi:predicted ester cyclase